MNPHLDTDCAIRDLERRLLLERVAKERPHRAGLANRHDPSRDRGWRRLMPAWRTIVPLRLWAPRREAVDPAGVVRA